MYQFEIEIYGPVGNNKFSYSERAEKSIYVPKLHNGKILESDISSKYHFIEIVDAVENKCHGLKNFIREGNVFLFDNHNHTYYFYKKILSELGLQSMTFIHVDQHKDMRTPEKNLSEFVDWLKAKKYIDLGFRINKESGALEKFSFYENGSTDYNYLYANLVLNVGNFIQPLIYENKIEELSIVDSKYRMDNFDWQLVESDYALDLDMDFFSKDMDYFSKKEKVQFVRALMEKAKAIFIATSPFFISYEESMDALNELLNCKQYGCQIILDL